MSAKKSIKAAEGAFGFVDKYAPSFYQIYIYMYIYINWIHIKLLKRVVEIGIIIYC